MSYFLAIPCQFCNISRLLRDDDLTLRKERSFSVFFITYFVVIPTKTYTTLVLTYLYPCIIKLRRESINLSQKSLFGRQNNLSTHVHLQRVTMFARGDLRTLCSNARIRLLATHSLSKFVVTGVKHLCSHANSNQRTRTVKVGPIYVSLPCLGTP